MKSKRFEEHLNLKSHEYLYLSIKWYIRQIISTTSNITTSNNIHKSIIFSLNTNVCAFLSQMFLYKVQ